LETALSGSTISSEGLDERRRRLLLRAWRRGMRETDLIMGRFADAYIATLTDAELVEFERLLDVRDQDLLGWVTGEFATPPEYDTPFFRRLHAFHWAAGSRP
jgi:antitoxin CptB